MGTYNAIMGSVFAVILLGSAAYALVVCMWPVKADREAR